jgi:hypothetical protein
MTGNAYWLFVVNLSLLKQAAVAGFAITLARLSISAT